MVKLQTPQNLDPSLDETTNLSNQRLIFQLQIWRSSRESETYRMWITAQPSRPLLLCCTQGEEKGELGLFLITQFRVSSAHSGTHGSPKSWLPSYPASVHPAGATAAPRTGCESPCLRHRQSSGPSSYRTSWMGS